MPKEPSPFGKLLWILASSAAIGLLLWRSRADIIDALQQTTPSMLLISIFPLMLAKFLLGENARIAANRSGIELNYADATRLYNLSQLGKYLPGSVWQFIGRATAYRNQFGATIIQIRDSLLIESLWIVGCAFAVGALLCGAPLWRFLTDNAPTYLPWWLITLGTVFVLSLIALIAWNRTPALHYAKSVTPPVRVLLVQMGIWLLLGLSFWILVRACGMHVPPLFAIGLFAGSFAIGFLVPFAPAGLGIRDAALVVGLLPHASPGQALAVTIIARLIYLASEVLIVVTQGPIFRLIQLSAKVKQNLHK